MAASRSLKTLKITLSTEVVCCSRNSRTVLTAISAASWFGKWNSPVEMQQKATLRRPCSAASARQER